MSGKYNQKLLDHAKQQKHLKILQKVIQKTAQTTGDLIIKLLAKLWGFQKKKKNHNKIIQRELQMNTYK